MARKSATLPKYQEAVESFEALTEFKYELAKEVYDAQDAGTKKAIDRMVGVLQTYATGTIDVGQVVKITNEQLHQNLLYLAVEVVKDLAMLDIQVGNFVFLKSQCVTCGNEI